MENILIKVARDFSFFPGARYREEGDNSAQEFLEDHVLDKFDEARRRGVKLIIDLDGAAGYATSFLEGTFGGLARKRGREAVLETLEWISNDDPYLNKYIERYIEQSEGVVPA